MNDISDILRTLLDQYSQVSEAERQFARMMEDDSALSEDYRTWCEENGYSVKTGYIDYIDELMDSRDSIWENLDE